jgi:hypothetical protein
MVGNHILAVHARMLLCGELSPSLIIKAILEFCTIQAICLSLTPDSMVEREKLIKPTEAYVVNS